MARGHGGRSPKRKTSRKKAARSAASKTKTSSSTSAASKGGSKSKSPDTSRSATNARSAHKSAATRTPVPETAGLFDEILPKDGKLYYRIGEVSRITGVKPYVLRYWESEFRWMAPQKSRSKQRLYRRKDIEMILLIRRLLHEQRYTIAGARQKLRELGVGGAMGEAAQAQTPAGPLSSDLKPLDFCKQVRGELLAIRSLLASENA